MTGTKILPRGERVALLAVGAIPLLLAVLASYLPVPSAAWADATDLPSLVDRSAPAIRVYEPTIDPYVMPGREY